MKSKIKNSKGITLVALVITIVILIILATIAIQFSFGEDGLIKRAEEAKEYYANDTSYTDESLSNVVSYMNDILAGITTGGSEEGETEDTTSTTVENILKAGDYVTYPSAQGDLECRVLYDSSSGYGVQLITSSCVKDVALGNNDFTTSMESYNKAVETLNSEAGKYNNSIYSSRARCVGSHPTSTNDTMEYFTSNDSYMSSYNGKFKVEDENYEKDYEQMKKLSGVINISDTYWMASRYVKHIPSIMTYFYVRMIMENFEEISSDYMCGIDSNELPNTNSPSYGLRPVFILNFGIKVTGGNGTSDSPYILGV